jgi:WD40 repeat protein/ABC-type molybdenum transport system ATPase subunit/photorepair protein PhrA
MASRTFRIFVSSTFSDLKEERNALQKDVFPKLRDLCMQHGCRFQAIDLRWGVREEAALDQQTMKICLEEIKRCQKVTPRPNFIVLLGDRYGWRPLPYKIPKNEFEKILKKVSEEDKELLTQWYRRDDNAVLPVYDLQPRIGEFTDSKKWDAVERQLRSIFFQAIKEAITPCHPLAKGGWGDLTDDAHLKYTASATEQEIVHGALKVEDAKEHVFCFFRTIKDLPQYESTRDFIDLDKEGDMDIEAHKNLDDLKNRLRSLLPDNVYDYKAEWTGSSVTPDHLKKLCDDVYNSLSKVILEEVKRIKKDDPLEKEIEDHDVLGKERAKFFVGRVDILNRIDEYIRSGSHHPLAIYGESGSGKTALMAKAVEQAQRKYQDFEIIFRYIGSTPSSSDGRSLLENLCKQIFKTFNFEEQKRQKIAGIEGYDEESRERRQRIEKEYEIPSEFQKLSTTFRDFLTKIPGDKRLILFIDALDQLSETDHARNLTWLPADIHDNVHMVVSTLSGGCLSILEKKLLRENLVKLKPMPLNEGSKLLDLWLDEAKRKLQEHQRKEILEKFTMCGLPLYLKLAFEEARRWKSYTEKVDLSHDIPGITRYLFKRLSSDANHGKTMVSRSLGYMAAAKNGLTEDEMLDLLSLDKDVFEDFHSRAKHTPPEERLPVIVWSRLHFDLEPYLTERSADGTLLMTFYHRQLGEVVAEDYLSGEEKLNKHHSLAKYFVDQPHWVKTDKPRISNFRKMSELPYQQTYGEMWNELESTLCDLLFIEAKCAGGMTYDLITDYNRALDALPEAQEEKQKELEHEKLVNKYVQDLIAYAKGEIKHLDIIPSIRPWTEEEIRKDAERILNNPTKLNRIRAFCQFVTSEASTLQKYSTHLTFCMQHAYNYAVAGAVADAAKKYVGQDKENVMILKQPISLPAFVLYSTTRGTFDVSENINSVAVTADGKLAISGHNSGCVRVWKVEGGECLTTLNCENYSDNNLYIGYTPVAMTPDGKIAISGDDSGDVKVWDLESGNLIKILEAEYEDDRFSWGAWAVSSVAVTAEGRLAISGHYNGYIRVWSIKSGKCLRTLEGHLKRVNTVVITPDGRIAISGSEDCSIRRWDIGSGMCIGIFKRVLTEFSSIATTPDGKMAIIGSRLGLLWLWNIEDTRPKKIGDYHRALNSVAITPDSRLAITGYDDGCIMIWDLKNHKCIKTFKVLFSVDSVAITVDGGQAIVGGAHLHVFNIEKEYHLKYTARHSDEVRSIAISPDRRFAVSGSTDKSIRVWSLESGQCLKTYEGRSIPSRELFIKVVMYLFGVKKFPLKSWKILGGHSSPVNSVIITPDGRLVISGSMKTFRFWDLKKGRYLRSLKRLPSCRSIAITLDGRLLASCSMEKAIQIWDLKTGTCVKTLMGHAGDVNSVAITPDVKQIVSASEDKTVRVWDLETGHCVKILEGHSHKVDTVLISSNGRNIVSHSRGEGNARLWDLDSGTCIKILPIRHSISAITPDGKLAVTYRSFEIMIWDLETYCCRSIITHSSLISSITLGNDILAIGDIEGRVVFYNIHNVNATFAYATSVRLWNFDYFLKFNLSSWDKRVSFICEHCGNRLETPNEIINKIKQKSGKERDINLYLLSECPLCHKPLKFNPFIVDNRDRY